MLDAQLKYCSICKQSVENPELNIEPYISDKISQCFNCGSLYHSRHLEIWLRMDKDCPTCRNDLQKLAFIQFAIEIQQYDVSSELYQQLSKLFPRGIPKGILNKYIQKFPQGIPKDEFAVITEKHSKSRMTENEKRSLQVRKSQAIAYENQKNEVLLFFAQIFGFYLILILISIFA